MPAMQSPPATTMSPFASALEFAGLCSVNPLTKVASM